MNDTATQTAPTKTKAPRRSKEEIALDIAEAAVIRAQKHNAALDRLVAAAKAHRAASEAAREKPTDAKLLTAWSTALVELEAAGLAVARYITEKDA